LLRDPLLLGVTWRLVVVVVVVVVGHMVRYIEHQELGQLAVDHSVA
jgi:hypothetical protein